MTNDPRCHVDPPAFAGPILRLRQARPGFTRTRRLALASMALGALLGPLAAHGGAVEAGDARAVRAVIESQLQAFAADDAERAFSFASATIRAQFGNAGRFMAMVQGGYPMVVRPTSTAFFRPESVDGAIWQKVHLRDAAGRLWLATYELVRQADQAWRINGCSVSADAAGPTT